MNNLKIKLRNDSICSNITNRKIFRNNTSKEMQNSHKKYKLVLMTNVNTQKNIPDAWMGVLSRG